MDTKTLILTSITLLSWGISSFVAKLAANRIGDRSVFWDMVGFIPAIVIYCVLMFRGKNFFQVDQTGILFAILAGAIGSFGSVGFYMLVTRKDASTAVPLTALYPALAAILAFIFLKETITTVKLAGILLAMVAIYLLSL